MSDGAAYFFMFLIISRIIISSIILIKISVSISNTPFSVGVRTAAAAPVIKVTKISLSPTVNSLTAIILYHMFCHVSSVYIAQNTLGTFV